MRTIRFLMFTGLMLLGVEAALAERTDQDGAYILKALRIEGTDLAIVRLGVKTGSVWILQEDEWAKLSPPKSLPLSTYSCELVPVGKKSWILVLMDTVTGDTYIYASATKGWRFAGEAEE